VFEPSEVIVIQKGLQSKPIGARKTNGRVRRALSMPPPVEQGRARASGGRRTEPASAVPCCDVRAHDVSGVMPACFRRRKQEGTMGRQVAVALYVLALVAVVVGVDVVFFRNHFWERLTVNIGIVMVFAAFGFRFLRRA
jgi:hypothetical protein